MKNIVFLLVVFLGIVCNLSEACGGWSTKRRRRNPKIVVTTEKPTEIATEAMTEPKAKTTKAPTKGAAPTEQEVTTRNAPTEGAAPTEPEVTTRNAPTEGAAPTEPEVTTRDAPTEKAAPTEPEVTTQKAPTEGAAPTEPEVATKAPTEGNIPTEPKAVEPNTNMIDPLTRPTSVHRFFKQSAFVKSTKDERTCRDVDGQCKAECDVQTEYVQGSFQCPVSKPRCCGKR